MMLLLADHQENEHCFTITDNVTKVKCERKNKCFLKLEVTKRKIVSDNNILIFDKVIIYIYIYIYIYISFSVSVN